MIIQNGSVFTEKNTFEPMDILTEGAFISALSPSLKGRPKEEVYDASGCILIPGLVDLHFHGCMGHDLCDHKSETLRFIAAYELQHCHLSRHYDPSFGGAFPDPEIRKGLCL